MKILLLNPPVNIDDSNDYEVVKPPYGLAMISAVLKKDGYDVILWDPQAFHKTRNEMISYIRELKPDIVGMGSFTFQIGEVIKFVNEIKNHFPNMIIILGGPHISAVPEMTLKNHPNVDYVVIGEGEIIMQELIANINDKKKLSKINGLGMRYNNEIIVNTMQQPVKDLDSLPIADWESLPMGLYWDSLATKKTYGSVFASRGCPYMCSFCGAMVTNGRRVRKRNPKKFVAELSYLNDKWGIDEFVFGDSTFNFDNKWVQAICNEIQQLGKKIIWRCTVRGDRIDSDTIKIMKDSGCVKVLMGVESADPHVLKKMRKGETVEQLLNGLNTLIDCKMPVDTSYILGMPGDTPKSIDKTIEFAKFASKNFDNVASITLATPLPGTELYRIAVEEGLTVQDWTKFDSFQIAYVPKTMTRKQLEKCYRKSLCKLYFFNPVYLIKRLLQMTSWHQLKINIRYAFRILIRGLNISKNH